MSRTPGPSWARRAARALEAGRDPLAVSAGLTRRADALVRLLLRRATVELGPAPAPCAWLVLGGAGRRELAPGADLDHALVYAAGGAGAAEAGWWAAAAAHVARGLRRAGAVPCPGGWSAERRRAALGAWRARIGRWRTEADPAALLDLAVFLDQRRAAGRLDASALGVDAVRAAAAPPLRAALGEAALRLRCRSVAEVRLFPGRPLDLKRDALASLVAAARALGVAAGAAATGTLARLEAARAAGLLGPDTAAEGAAALRFLTGLRLRRGLSAVLSGVPASPVVVPAALPAADRARLAVALAAVRGVQRRVEPATGWEAPALRWR